MSSPLVIPSPHRLGPLVVAAIASVLAALVGVPPARAQSADSVELKDGTVLQGTVTRQEPGRFVVLRTADGRELTFTWDDIRRVVVAPRPAGSAAAEAPPSPQTGAAAPSSTSSFQAGDGQTSAQVTEDCARNPELERCRQTTGVTAGAGGVGVGTSFERRVLLKDPPTTVVRFTIEGGFMYGTGTGDGPSFDIVGGGGAIGVKVLTGGGPMPGTGGGTWSGFSIDPRANFHGAGIIMQDSGAGFTTGGGALSVSYQWLSYGTMDATTLEQFGWGFNLGYSGGLQLTRVYAEQTGDIEAAFSHGPVIGMLFPKYNAGTSKFEAGFFNFMLLPTGDFIFLMINGGAAF